MRQNSPVDYVARFIAILGVSIPDFLLGSLLLAWLINQFGWAPPIVYVSPWEDPAGNLAQYILPALILGYRLSATTMRMTRSTMLEILREDYIRTAWAKGLRERLVVIRHAMRNALVPVVTIIGMQAGYLLAGSVVIETVFNLPGMGRLLVQSISVRDYPQVQATILLVGVVMVLVNLLVDLSYAVLDPRVRAG
jgi:peptide/nickel transport system permease protein